MNIAYFVIDANFSLIIRPKNVTILKWEHTSSIFQSFPYRNKQKNVIVNNQRLSDI